MSKKCAIEHSSISNFWTNFWTSLNLNIFESHRSNLIGMRMHDRTNIFACAWCDEHMYKCIGVKTVWNRLTIRGPLSITFTFDIWRFQIKMDGRLFKSNRWFRLKKMLRSIWKEIVLSAIQVDAGHFLSASQSCSQCLFFNCFNIDSFVGVIPTTWLSFHCSLRWVAIKHLNFSFWLNSSLTFSYIYLQLYYYHHHRYYSVCFQNIWVFVCVCASNTRWNVVDIHGFYF